MARGLGFDIFVNVDLWGLFCNSLLDNNPIQTSMIGKQTFVLISHSHNVSAFGLTLEHSCCDGWHRLQFGNLVTSDNF